MERAVGAPHRFRPAMGDVGSAFDKRERDHPNTGESSQPGGFEPRCPSSEKTTVGPATPESSSHFAPNPDPTSGRIYRRPPRTPQSPPLAEDEWRRVRPVDLDVPHKRGTCLRMAATPSCRNLPGNDRALSRRTSPQLGFLAQLLRPRVWENVAGCARNSDEQSPFSAMS